VVDPESGTVRFVPQFPDWHGQPLQELLTQSLSAPVLVRSEAHLAVAGEHWRGAAAGAKSAVYVQMGVGVGMGVMIDGVVYRGAAGAAGEIGYLPISGSPAPQSPQGFGPLESAVGAAAFTRLAREAIENGKGAGILAVATDEEPGPEAVIQAAAAGDRTAGAIVEAILTTLEKGLISITAVLNPEIVVLGGGLAPSLEPHLPRLQKALGSAVPVPPTLVITALADNATALGALRLGVDHVETQVFNSLASP
jgi:predicted NBD/HSP70 family sugar kinase